MNIIQDESEYHRAEDESYSDDGYVTDYHESFQDEEDHPEQTRGVSTPSRRTS